MKFVYYNDTGRVVSIHSATRDHGCIVNTHLILPFNECTFTLPKGTYPWVKMWDYKDQGGLQILVSPREYEE